MALISNLETYDLGRSSRHGKVRAAYACFGTGPDKVLQIKTMGSETRVHVGVASQTIQFDRNSAKALFDILKQEFGFSP